MRQLRILAIGLSVLFSFATLAESKKPVRPIDQMGTAVGMGDLKKFEELLPKIQNIDEELNPIGETALTLAAYNSQPKMVEALIKRGANVNHQTKNGYSALIFAAMIMRPPAENAIQTAKILLKAGANKLLKNADGDTAYSLAVKKKATDLEKLLE